jgi:hypothetical protein
MSNIEGKFTFMSVEEINILLSDKVCNSNSVSPSIDLQQNTLLTNERVD